MCRVCTCLDKASKPIVCDLTKITVVIKIVLCVSGLEHKEFLVHSLKLDF